MGKITEPQPLEPEHRLSQFTCEEEVLDNWLKKRALKKQYLGASRTFVVCNEEQQVIACYSLATGAIENKETPGKVRRNMPNSIPVMLLGRLAVDYRYKGRGLGTGLLRDAILRTLTVAQQAGIKALLVHALSEQAKLFYKYHGFYESTNNSMTLLITLDDAMKSVAD
ncbi:MAG: GNAT family N-acetyltransferase [Gammaproteobacteria bacterium]|nr:MAG: GNAT family N-acetyltransferase [Gammaproteobacteria bacterium]